MNLEKQSKFLSYVLRHHPEKYNLDIDSEGWVDVEELLKNTKFGTLEDLKYLVENETRYTFNENYTKIRAFHGHSVKGISYKKNEMIPPDVLYHGTSTTFYTNILKDGLIKGMCRVNVHLSVSKEEAKKIGLRHGKPVILEIDTKKMYEDGFKFSKSEDGVWLVENVPTKYIKNTY